MPQLDPSKLKIGDVVLVAGGKGAVQSFQERAGCGQSARWTHVAGCLGGVDAVETRMPRSRLVNIQKEYIDKGLTIKVMRRKGQAEAQRYKTAIWWATMNNLPYDTLQIVCFPLVAFFGRAVYQAIHNLFGSSRRFVCSELIATGFYKEGDYLFNKPATDVLPADFDNLKLFEEVGDIWLNLN